MPLKQPIITIALSRADLAMRRSEILPDLIAAVIGRQRAHGDPEVVCAAYEPSLTAALGASMRSLIQCCCPMTNVFLIIFAARRRRVGP
jgi:hypothetical protein